MDGKSEPGGEDHTAGPELRRTSCHLLDPGRRCCPSTPLAANRPPHREEESLRMNENSTELRLPLHLSMDNPEPMYAQIESQLKDLILEDVLEPGTKLPSIR